MAAGYVGLDRPHRQPGVGLSAAIAPGRAVSMAMRHGSRSRRRLRSGGFAPFAWSGWRRPPPGSNSANGHPAPSADAGGPCAFHMALEVHLPQVVGGFVLEADKGLCPAANPPVRSRCGAGCRSPSSGNSADSLQPWRSCVRPRPGPRPQSMRPPPRSPGGCGGATAWAAASVPPGPQRLPP